MKKLFFALSILLLLVTTQSNATHVMGGDITYRHHAGDTLLVTLKIYRDCNGIALSNSPVLVSSEKGASAQFSLPQTSVKDITGVLPKCGFASRCTSSSFPYGFEEYIFTGKVVLPNDSSCKYTLSWEQCCRNTAITTGAANMNFYIETTLDKCLALGNSSPDFVREPIIVLNTGQDLSLTHAAKDPDNDLVTYELAHPLLGANQQISYSGSHSAKKPITFLGFPNAGFGYPAGLRFDSLTSNMSFRPTKQNEITVVSIKAKEWRKISGSYVQIGEVIRDIQLLVLSSPTNKIPQIGLLNQSNIFACTAGNHCITIPVTDKDSADTLSYSYAHNLSNAVITDTTVNDTLKVTICFNVTQAMLVSGNYFFTLFVQDDACPMVGKTEKTYHLKTSALVSVPHPQKFIYCESDPSVTLATPPTGTSVWSGNGVLKMGTVYTFKPSYALPGWHQLNFSYLDSLNCAAKDSLLVRVVARPSIGFTANDTIGLPNDTFYFTNTSTADTSFTSRWNFGDSGSLVNTYGYNSQHSYNDVGEYTVRLFINNGICPTDSLIKVNHIKIGSNYLSVQSPVELGLIIYPSPASEMVVIEAQSELKEVLLTDMTGKVYRFAANGNKAELNISELATGTYIIKAIDTQGKQYIGKVLVQR